MGCLLTLALEVNTFTLLKNKNQLAEKGHRKTWFGRGACDYLGGKTGTHKSNATHIINLYGNQDVATIPLTL